MYVCDQMALIVCQSKKSRRPGGRQAEKFEEPGLPERGAPRKAKAEFRQSGREEGKDGGIGHAVDRSVRENGVIARYSRLAGTRVVSGPRLFASVEEIGSSDNVAMSHGLATWRSGFYL